MTTPDAVPGFDADAVKAAAEQALICAIMGAEGNTGDDVTAAFADAMAVITENGPRAVHVALSGWCGLLLHSFADAQGVPVAGGFWSLEVENPDGQAASVDEVGDPAAVAVMRIVTCLGNNDHATIAAITAAAWDASTETLTDLMVTAVKLAAQAAVLHREARNG